jgi:hypothetical protein
MEHRVSEGDLVMAGVVIMCGADMMDTPEEARRISVASMEKALRQLIWEHGGNWCTYVSDELSTLGAYDHPHFESIHNILLDTVKSHFKGTA